MSSTSFPVILIVAAIFISWNGIGTGAYLHQDAPSLGYQMSETKVVEYPNIFLQNFFRTSCITNEIRTGCLALNGGTCWSPTIEPRTLCVEGCKCINGYLRNSEGLCVASEQCDTTIKPVDYKEPRLWYQRYR